ncbi:hypothetical protein [Kineococcus sp. SYSU DK018]|uniref:hypothetical protein n=1 Tax=Kineococcus sp. SYSU DK018 TaxID=3383139 RepID=UPI003D7D308C
MDEESTSAGASGPPAAVGGWIGKDDMPPHVQRLIEGTEAERREAMRWVIDHARQAEQPPAPGARG